MTKTCPLDREWLDSVNSDRRKDQLDKVSYEIFEIVMDRLEKENPDAMKMDPPNPRSYRPSTMRRDHGASLPAKRVIKVDIDEGVEDMG